MRAHRGYGAPTLTALVVANMIGAGVFTTSGFALDDLGAPGRVLAAWIVGGVIALCGAAGYAALARRLTESGGEYLFLSRAVHPALGFVAGWVSLLAGFTGAIAFAALAFESYVRPQWSVPDGVLAIAIIALAALLHGVRATPGAWAQNGVVAVKLVAIVTFTVMAFAAPRPELPAVAAGPFSIVDFARALVWISLAYSGFNAAVYVAGEAHEARRNVPRALVVGTVVVTVLYVALNTVFVALVPVESVRGRPDVAAAAAAVLLGPGGERLVRIIVALALASSVSSMIMAGPRVFARMADDGLLPARLGSHGQVPRTAIVVQAVLASALVLASDLRGLLSYLGLTLSLSAAATVAALFVLRRREGPAGASGPIGLVLPAIYVVATLVFAVLSAQRQPLEVGAAASTLVSGVVVHQWITRGGRG